MRDGCSEKSPIMGRFCGIGSIVPASLQSTQNCLRIRWDLLVVKCRISLFLLLHGSSIVLPWKAYYENGYGLIFVLSGSNQIILIMAKDFNLNISPLMCPFGATAVVNVVVISRLQMALSHHHLSPTITLRI